MQRDDVMDGEANESGPAMNADQRDTGIKIPSAHGSDTDPDGSAVAAVDSTATTARFGFWVSIATAALTVLTFALAITALPNKVEYPFTSDEIVDQWPG